MSTSRFGGFAALVVARAISALGILAAGIIVARWQGPSHYGQYATAFALGSIIVGGPTVGVPTLLLRRTAEGSVDRGVARESIVALLKLALAAIAVDTALGCIVIGGWAGAVTALTGGVAFAALSVVLVVSNLHSGRLGYLPAAAAESVAGVLFPVLTAVALWLHTGIAGTLLAIALAAGAGAAIGARTLTLPDLEGSRAMTIRETAPFIALGSLNAGYNRVDAVALSMVRSNRAVGEYSAAYRILGPFNLFGSALATVFLSALSLPSHSDDEWRHIRRQWTLRFVVGSVALCALGEAFAPLFIRGLYGHAYEGAIGPARILLLSIIPWSIYWPTTNAMNAVHLERRVTAILGAAMALDFVLVLVFGSYLGAAGAAWSWLAVEVLSLVGTLALSRGLAERRPRPQ